MSRLFGRVARHIGSLSAEILRSLKPLNAGRDKRDQITYDSLWIHAKRHYDFTATAAYRRTLMAKEAEFKESLRG